MGGGGGGGGGVWVGIYPAETLHQNRPNNLPYNQVETAQSEMTRPKWLLSE